MILINTVSNVHLDTYCLQQCSIISTKYRHGVEGTLGPERSRQRFSVSLASNIDGIREAQHCVVKCLPKRRMETILETPLPLHDVDEFDAHCHHVLVRDQNTGKVVSSMRSLLTKTAKFLADFTPNLNLI
ncbi:MAG: GNAT family N-acyltransferase [Thiotrichaceae bacterium]